MYCTNCGNKLASGANYCSKCGKKVGATTTNKNTSAGAFGCLAALLYIPFGIIMELTKKYK